MGLLANLAARYNVEIQQEELKPINNKVKLDVPFTDLKIISFSTGEITYLHLLDEEYSLNGITVHTVPCLSFDIPEYTTLVTATMKVYVYFKTLIDNDCLNLVTPDDIEQVYGRYSLIHKAKSV